VPLAILILYAFVLGAVTGSFLNVCVHRLPRGFNLYWPPSHCPFCNERIRWYDNIPILSYLLLGRRCRFCGIRISPRYALVEALTGILFAYVAWRVACGSTVDYVRLGVYAAVTGALVAASFVDIEFRIIPDEISIPGALLAPVVSLAWPWIHLPTVPGQPWDPIFVEPLAKLFGATPAANPHVCGLLASLVGMALGAGLIWALGVVGRALFRKEAMGFGDVKLMAFVGGFIGWGPALLGIVLGACAGAIVGVLMLFRSRDTRLPFGPYLSLGSFVAMLHAGDIVALFERFSAFIQGVQ
jgi:leader peptidase (prepilin peptidase)/N-methyltransferase